MLVLVQSVLSSGRCYFFEVKRFKKYRFVYACAHWHLISKKHSKRSKVHLQHLLAYGILFTHAENPEQLSKQAFKLKTYLDRRITHAVHHVFFEFTSFMHYVRTQHP